MFKSFEVLAKITIGPPSSDPVGPPRHPSPGAAGPPRAPPADANAFFALDILDSSRQAFQSRDRTVFSTIINLHSFHHGLLPDLSKVIEFMCTLQPPEFVYLSFALELDAFVHRSISKSVGAATEHEDGQGAAGNGGGGGGNGVKYSLARDLDFVSSFVQQMNHVLLTARETSDLRNVLRDCIGPRGQDLDERKVQLFNILLNAFSHNLVAMLSLCLWAGAFETGSIFLHRIDALDINLMLYLEIDQLIELLERPLFRHLHLRMFEDDETTNSEGSGVMLFRTLQRLLMILPQSTGYSVLKNRLVSVARYRQSECHSNKVFPVNTMTETFVHRIEEVRRIHCDAKWSKLRSESLEQATLPKLDVDVKQGRREWMGYASEAEENRTKQRYKQERESNLLKSKKAAASRGGPKEGIQVTYTVLGENEMPPDEPDPVISDEEDAGTEGGTVGDEDSAGSLRHPDEVLPRDQLQNFKKLARKGLLHDARTPMISLETNATGGSGAGGAHASGGSERQPDKWKEFWTDDGEGGEE